MRERLFALLVRLHDALADKLQRSPTLRLVLPREAIDAMEEIERVIHEHHPR